MVLFRALAPCSAWYARSDDRQGVVPIAPEWEGAAPIVHHALPDGDGQVSVFHFPRVIQCVICRVADQIAERPGAGWFALGMKRANGSAKGVSVRSQAVVRQQLDFRGAHPDLRGPAPFRAKRMQNDPVSIAPAPAWPFSQLRRHARTHVIEKRPARLHQVELTFQFFTRQVLPIDA